MSRSLFNVRNKAEGSEVPPPANTGKRAHSLSIYVVQISAIRRVPGLVNFILALAYYYCLALPAEFMQPEAHILAQPCNSYIYLTLHFARCLFGELLSPLATPDDLPLMSFIEESPIS